MSDSNAMDVDPTPEPQPEAPQATTVVTITASESHAEQMDIDGETTTEQETTTLEIRTDTMPPEIPSTSALGVPQFAPIVDVFTQQPQPVASSSALAHPDATQSSQPTQANLNQELTQSIPPTAPLTDSTQSTHPSQSNPEPVPSSSSDPPPSITIGQLPRADYRSPSPSIGRPSIVNQSLEPMIGTQSQSIIPSATPQKMTRTGYVYDPLMMLHCTSGYEPTPDHSDGQVGEDTHPEEPMRIKRIFSRLAEQGLIKRMKRLAFEEVTFEQAILVHSEDHWNKVQGTEGRLYILVYNNISTDNLHPALTDQIIEDSKQYYEALSLYVCRETARCARLSCGGVIQACISVCQKEVRNAFAIVRPPGHHAEPDEHMGFCFYNNVAVAARDVINKGLAKKVLILDWDVHHGNGTQRAFWDDPNVLYISIHRHDGGRFYPTSDFGALDMVGTHAGEGKTVNIPWPQHGFGDADYIYAFQKIVMPIAYEFDPDLVIISAGFDAAEGDKLGGCHVTPAAYGHMTHMLCALAGGKVVVALEGGYNLNAISDSALAVAHVLLGETPAELDVSEASELATEVIYQVAKVQSRYWKSINVPSCEPPEVTETEDIAPVISIPGMSCYGIDRGASDGNPKDLLKIHRAHHLYTKYKLFQIPLASTELEDNFGGQIICTENVYEAGPSSTMVVFVHDLWVIISIFEDWYLKFYSGNLRVETDGVSTSNVHLTNSYLLDTSDLIVNWVLENGYGLIDVNVLRQIPTLSLKPGNNYVTKGGNSVDKQLMLYIWDNYIQLSEAANVVLIGHGTACAAVMDLVNHREVERKVKAVVQVAGMHSMIRIDPNNESRRDWFRKNNRVYLPSAHPVLEEERSKKRLGGQIIPSEHAKVVDVLNDVLPQIKAFVGSQLAAANPAPSHLVDGQGNGSDIAGPAMTRVSA
ncbi:histone deacetylase 6, partial [Tremellales sp. Uapishka_1]